MNELKNIYDYENLSKMNKMKLLKEQLDQIEKQYEIDNNGYHRHFSTQRQAMPILDDLFDLDGLDKFLEEKQERFYKQDDIEKNYVKYLHEIKNKKLSLNMNIQKANDVKDIKIKYSIVYNEFENWKRLNKILFWLENDKSIEIVLCSDHSSYEGFLIDDKEKAEKKWKEYNGGKKIPLSLWKEVEKDSSF